VRTKVFIKKAAWVILAVILIPLAAVFTTIYALEAYSRAPFLEQSKTWGNIVSELEKKLTPKEMDALTMEELSVEINSLDKIKQQDSRTISIADELFTKLVQVFKEQPKKKSITKKQRVICESLAELATGIQRFRKTYNEQVYDDAVWSQESINPIVKILAQKIHEEVPLEISPLDVGLDFKEYCLGSYGEANEKDSTF